MGKILLFPTCCNCNFFYLDLCLFHGAPRFENGYCVSFEENSQIARRLMNNADNTGID